jgi:hypothetical protein
MREERMEMASKFDFKAFVLQQWRRDAERVRQYVDALAGDLTEAELNWQAHPGHHSIWHHIWHMFLVYDHYVAGALGVRPVWEEGDWRSRIDLSPMAQAFAQTGLANEFVPRFTICKVPDSLVDELKAPPLKQYLAYVDDMFAQCTVALERASESQLAREIMVNGKPMSVLQRVTDFAHFYRHIGMMEDLRGLIRGAGKGSATS